MCTILLVLGRRDMKIRKEEMTSVATATGLNIKGVERESTSVKDHTISLKAYLLY